MIKAKIIDIDGLKLIYEKTDVNNMFCFLPTFTTGAETETDENCGITHFLEHMFKKRTTDLSPEQIAEKLRVIMPYYNARTSFYYMGIDGYASLRYLEEAIALIADLVTNPVFIDEDSEKEKKVIVQEIARYEIENGYIANKNLANIFYKYPFIKNEVLGTKEKVLSYTAKDIEKRYKELFTKQNMFISFSGNVSEKKIVELVKKYFSKIPSNPKHIFKRKNYKINGKEDIVLFFKEEDKTITTRLGFACNYDDQDKKQRIFGRIFEHYLNHRGYPMFTQMRDVKALVYGYSAGIAGLIGGDRMAFNFSSTKENIKECISTFASILDDLYNNGIKKEYFDDIKQAIIVSYDARIETPTQRAGANSSAHLYFNDDFFDLDAHLKLIESVKIEEFNAFIKQLLKSNFVGASLVGNCTKDDIQTLDELRAMFYKK